MDKLIAEKYELKELSSEEFESYEKNIKLFDNLTNQLEFVKNLETDGAIEETEKNEYLFIISNQINKLSKMIIDAFYKIKE